MNTSYYIFKTDNLTEKTVLICGGTHDNEEQCQSHWRAYMYGFYDQAIELLGHGNFEFVTGARPLSFHLSIQGKKNVDYFMLLNEEGQKLIDKIA